MPYICHMKNEPTFTVKKLVAMTPEMAQHIDAYRFEQRIKSESEAIRLLISRGLAAEVVHAPADPAVTAAPKDRKKRRGAT
jgi:hypothetical protein